MHTLLPAPVRRLMLDCYRDCVVRDLPGYQNSLGYKRDRKSLATMSDEELLIGLPTLGRQIDLSLATSDTGLPMSFVASLFPSHPHLFSGILGGEWDYAKVRCMRQVCYLFSKLSLDGNVSGVEAAISDFLERNKWATRPIEGCEILYRTRDLITTILGSIDWHDIRPKHGPGAVATREKPWEKWVFKRMYRHVEDLYPFTDFMFLNYTHLCDELHRLPLLQEIDEAESRMVAVPKDFRGPRLICAEPLELQWLQQGQRRAIEQAVESHPLTKGRVNFDNQLVNRDLACQSSVNQAYVTLDLKDASDMLSHSLIRECLPPTAFKFLDATRSRSVCLPDGSRVPMNIFSPMGSAVCFPLESLVFFSIAHAAIASSDRRPLSWSRSNDVYVFGDDLIVRREYLLPIAQALTDLGIKLNENKCCIASRFRESCGGDFFCGQDITPVRIKSLPSRRSPISLASSTDYINSLVAKSLTDSADTYKRMAEAEFGTLPTTCYDLPCTLRARSKFDSHLANQSFTSRWNSKYQRREYLIKGVEPLRCSSVEPAWCEVFASIQNIAPWGNTFGPIGAGKSDRGHPVPHRVRLTTRWTAL